MRTIAYVEDQDSVRDLTAERLRAEGFEVAAYSSKEEALEAFRTTLPDLALLDVSHAGERDAGYQICTELRRLSADLPILFLTSHDGEIDQISGFRLGADDYVAKSASMDYLVVRIEALLRRTDAVRDTIREQRTPGLESSGVEMDEELSALSWKGTRLDLPLTHFWITRELCLHPGQVRSHRDLMKAANIVVEPNTIAAHVKAIRSCFCAVDPDFDCIRTERGRGYRWIPR